MNNIAPSPTAMRLGDLLVAKGYLKPEDLQKALERQRQESRRRLLGEILIDSELCTEEQILLSLTRKMSHRPLGEIGKISGFAEFPERQNQCNCQ